MLAGRRDLDNEQTLRGACQVGSKRMQREMETARWQLNLSAHAAADAFRARREAAIECIS